MTHNLQSTQAQGLGWVYSHFTYSQIAYSQASFTWQRFNQKEHRFMLIFNVCLHGDSENDHKNANGLQSEAFQKRIGNGLRVNTNNGRRCS